MGNLQYSQSLVTRNAFTGDFLPPHKKKKNKKRKEKRTQFSSNQESLKSVEELKEQLCCDWGQAARPHSWEDSNYHCGASPCFPTWPRRRQPKRRRLPKPDSDPERDMKKMEMLSQNLRWQKRKSRRPMAERPQEMEVGWVSFLSWFSKPRSESGCRCIGL